MPDEATRRTADLFLLAAFLGISAGCLAASSRRNLIDTVIPILLSGMTLACVVLYVFTKYSDVMIDVGGQGSPQQIFFGTEYRARDLSRFVVPLEAVAGVFFGLVALTFVRDATAPDVALGSNIGGAILGGLSEKLSLLIGFNNLGVLALLFDALSALSLRQQT